ncbi:hypothetical protein KNO15_09945 [Leifsonia shinshuensis]|uniref:hypothetical protein n=1 Tax=Leifsonia shinshuensis TaxID=150026 RepID=UPI001F504299|nr:hypothetical protein [Leifsonia shinshuensis]MCI0157015.1 hypothetical protein [Leifsonia shinshuensis]
MRKRGPGFALVVGLGFLLAVGGLGGVSAPASADQGDGGGIGISVDIPGATPTPGVGDGGSGASSGGGSTPSDTPSDVAGTGPTPTPTAPATTGGSNGPLNVGGLSARFVPDLNPGHGTIVATIAVHNGSSTAFAPKARFTLTNSFGTTIADSGLIAGPTIQPGKTAQLTQRLDGVGQWTFVTAHATITPPAVLDGHTMKPVLRDTLVFAFPWVGAVSIVLMAGAAAIIVVVRSSLGLGLVAAGAGA